jgi:alkanesulfonate monooxygenase SsuD/methylene tetrahydromethanopterin reductase-like flavin-dependent oxidoreductase (luciferase family)
MKTSQAWSQPLQLLLIPRSGFRQWLKRQRSADRQQVLDVHLTGEFFQVKDYVRFIHAAYDRVPIYMAGVNRRMIRLAGSHADV